MAGLVPQPVPTMASLQMIDLTSLIDDAKCYELIRHHRWPEGICCTSCSSAAVIRHGHDEIQRHRQRYRCKDCGARFDDVTGTVLAGHHQPLRVWVLCLYFMGLNLSHVPGAKRRAGMRLPGVGSGLSGFDVPGCECSREAFPLRPVARRA
jgi:transposase-like protein